MIINSWDDIKIIRDFEKKIEDQLMKEAEVIPLNTDPIVRIEGHITRIFDEEGTGGYGFISSRSKPYTRIFFHWSALVPNTKDFTELKKGDKVKFDLIKYEDKGWRALKIEVLP